jgi:hypothetical protein
LLCRLFQLFLNVQPVMEKKLQCDWRFSDAPRPSNEWLAVNCKLCLLWVMENDVRLFQDSEMVGGR